MTGKELKLQRITADIKGIDLAAEMGVDGSWVSRIENMRVVTPAASERYLAALATLTTSSTAEKAAGAA